MQLNLFRYSTKTDQFEEPHIFDSKTGNPFSETLLHQIWASNAFRFDPLVTLNHHFLYIINAGKLNFSDGPDFEYATVRDVNGLLWHGAIEFHVHENDWFLHGHHNDPNYDKVVVHIFLEKGTQRARCRKNGPIPFHVQLRFDEKTSLLDYIPNNHQAYCKAFSKHFPSSIWQTQLNLAIKRYFNDLCKRFANIEHSSESVLNLLTRRVIIELWSHLGIPNNRELMKDLAHEWLDKKTIAAHRWKKKGNRSSKLTSNAKNLAIELSEGIIKLSNENKSDLEYANKLIDLVRNNTSISPRLKNRIIRFVLIPASYTYFENICESNDCLQITTQKEKLYEYWLQLNTPVPAEIKNYFEGIQTFDEQQISTDTAKGLKWLAQKRYFLTRKAVIHV